MNPAHAEPFPTPGPAFFINLQTGVTSQVNGTSNATPGWDIGFYNYHGLYLLQNTSSAQGRSAAVIGHDNHGFPWGGFAWAGKFGDGVTIGGAHDYFPNFTNLAMADYGGDDYIPFGEWLFGANHEYLGLRFMTEDMTLHYGWIRMDVEPMDFPNSRATVIDWAYESIPNTAIVTGAVPEPASCAALTITALAAAGARARGRRNRIA